MSSFTKRDFINYAVLPGFRQRLQDLLESGFQYIPYFIAIVYGAVRLLPEGHPYLSPVNMGRFGIRHVIAEAANNIVLSRKNIDQILLFVCVLFGLIIVILQLILLFTGIVIQPVMALPTMPTNFAGFFVTPNPEQDLAHIMLDMVFGIPNLFDSCVGTGTACRNIFGTAIVKDAGAPGGVWLMEGTALPFPIHRGLHELFYIYNIGLTIVGVFIASYFIATVVLETAQTGTPMGKRFNKVWAPVRFVVAFGLLFPITYHLSSAQYIVLYAAKFGSGFATNGWTMFYETMNYYNPKTLLPGVTDNDPTVPSATGHVAKPQTPDLTGLIQFLFVAKACADAHKLAYPSMLNIEPYIVKNTVSTVPYYQFTVASGTPAEYDNIINFIEGENKIIIRFGYPSARDNPNAMGTIAPICGELNYTVTDPRLSSIPANPDTAAEPAIVALQMQHLQIISNMWYSWLDNLGINGEPNVPDRFARRYAQFNATKAYDPNLVIPDISYKRALIDSSQAFLEGVINASVDVHEQSNSQDFYKATFTEKGWGGAGIWFNKIAELNGSFSSAVLNAPTPTSFPSIMESVYAEKRQGEEGLDFAERFNPRSNNGQASESLSETDKKIAYVLWNAYNYWEDVTSSSYTAPTGNNIIDIINALFGTEGLFNMRKNEGVHPLAQLAGVGRSLVEGAVRNLSYAAIGGASGGLARLADAAGFAGAASNASSFLITFAMIGLTAGFVLFYVVPFLPFIYFFFALGGWVKGIFEAMVGAPLWALAHLRIDGHGLSGQAAVSGYFLIFEVFLRPILIVFGLLASISIFSALVSVLNQIFDLVVMNVGGFDAKYEMTGAGASSKMGVMRSALDKFFYTIIYTIIVYLIGMSCFKLVDLIPNNILRWMGQSVATFGDQQEDFGQSLVGTSTMGAQQTLGSLSGGLQKMASIGKS